MFLTGFTSKKAKILMFKTIGIVFVGLAMFGVILPILPTTPFLLVAAACFANSSPKMQGWLFTNKIFGPMINDWQKHCSIPKKAKYIALSSIVLSVAWSAYVLKSTWLTLLIVALVIGLFIFIWRLPESKV